MKSKKPEEPDMFKGMFDDEEGGARHSDPETSKDAARKVRTGRIKKAILRKLHEANTPLNGWELSERIGLPTISVVPRLSKMRDEDGWIVQDGQRLGPPPSLRMQIAYVLTASGREIASKLL